MLIKEEWPTLDAQRRDKACLEHVGAVIDRGGECAANAAVIRTTCLPMEQTSNKEVQRKANLSKKFGRHKEVRHRHWMVFTPAPAIAVTSHARVSTYLGALKNRKRSGNPNFDHFCGKSARGSIVEV